MCTYIYIKSDKIIHIILIIFVSILLYIYIYIDSLIPRLRLSDISSMVTAGDARAAPKHDSCTHPSGQSRRLASLRI